MIRIFGILSIVAVLMSLFAGSGVYWMSQSDVEHAKQKATTAVAQGIALSISAQVKTLQKTVSKMATTPEVISAIESGDPQQIAEITTLLEQLLPNVMKIRLLPATVTELDESSIPHMGNADLIMAQETLKIRQPPVIQGQGENRHLAITALISKDKQPIGIILASLKFDFLQSILKSSNVTDEIIELKQKNASLAKIGDASAEIDLSNSLKVPQTAWSIHYASISASSIFSTSIIIGLISIPALFICLAFFIAYRNLTHIIRQDQGIILKAIKDLISGKTVGSYPVSLNEMKTLISSMIQFKRVLDNDGKDFSIQSEGDTELDTFFDEPEGVSFLDMDLDSASESNEIQMPSTPISLPETAQLDFPDLSIVNAEPEPVKKKKIAPTIYRAYDIRGIVDSTLTKEIVFNIGKAVASEVKEKNINTIIVGRDGRLSSPSLAEALSEGITSTGVNVLDIGLAPSPLVYFVAQHTEGKSAIVVTASHNPADYNGLKIIIDGESLAGERIQQIKQRIEKENFITAETKGSIDQNDMFSNEYIGVISEDIHLVRPMKVVVDCGNGATGKLAPTLLSTLGCEVIKLFCTIDGTFPNHHPDPADPENLNDLIAAVHQHDADLGIAFDGDGDRLGVIDSRGKLIWPDRLMMLFAEDVLANKPGAEIIFDVKSSRHLQEHITKHGGRPLMSRTGHSFIKTKLKETGAALAGEMSGHIFFNDRWFGFDDALYSAARLIGILSADKHSSSEVFAKLPNSSSTPEINIELEEGEGVELMEQLLSKANFKKGKINTLDGLRVDFADGWGLVRASNTMPALALRFEADDMKTIRHIQSQFKELLLQVKPNLKVPF